MIEVNTIKCPKCKDVIYSRAVHDFHECSCGAVNIDGGFEYFHYGWDEDVIRGDIIETKLKLDATEDILYNDWNKRINKYGIIKEGDTNGI